MILQATGTNNPGNIEEAFHTNGTLRNAWFKIRIGIHQIQQAYSNDRLQSLSKNRASTTISPNLTT
jgi:hypothetical protein